MADVANWTKKYVKKSVTADAPKVNETLASKKTTSIADWAEKYVNKPITQTVTTPNVIIPDVKNFVAPVVQEPKSQLIMPTADPMEAGAVYNQLMQQEALAKAQTLGDKTYDDNFLGQFGASYSQGSLSQKASVAWSDYLKNPTEENKTIAQGLSQALSDFGANNQEVLADDATLPWISQSVAGYLPQLIDQTKASVTGALWGGVAGSAVPVVGTAAGIKAGAVAGSSLQMYDTVKGGVYSELIAMGVDDATARSAANDEAIVSGLIEAGDTVLDLATLGGGTLIKTLLKGGTKAATSSAGKAILKGLAKYGINVAAEGLQEGVQEGVSIANLQRIAKGDETGIGSLAKESGAVGKEYFSGDTPWINEQINAAAKQGLIIAGLVGGTQKGVNTVGNQKLLNQQTAPVEAAPVGKRVAQDGATAVSVGGKRVAQGNQKSATPGKRLIQAQNALPVENPVEPVEPVVENVVETAAPKAVPLPLTQQAISMGDNINDATVRKVLASPEALAELGITFEKGLENSQKRQIIKNVVANEARKIETLVQSVRAEQRGEGTPMAENDEGSSAAKVAPIEYAVPSVAKQNAVRTKNVFADTPVVNQDLTTENVQEPVPYVADAVQDEAEGVQEDGGLDEQEWASIMKSAPGKEAAPPKAITSKKALKQEVLDAFGVAPGMRKELGDKIDAAADELYATGKISDATKEDLMNDLYGNGTVMRDATDVHGEVRKAMQGKRVYIDAATLADLGDNFNTMRKAAWGDKIYLTTKRDGAVGIDVLAQDLAEIVGAGVIKQDAAMSDQLQTILKLVEQGRGKTLTLEEDASNLGAEYGSGAIEEQIMGLERALDDAFARFGDKAELEVSRRQHELDAVAKEKAKTQKVREQVKEQRGYTNAAIAKGKADVKAAKDEGKAELAIDRERRREKDAERRAKAKEREKVKQTFRDIGRLRKRVGYNDTNLAKVLNDLPEDVREYAQNALEKVYIDAKSLTIKAETALRKNRVAYNLQLEGNPDYLPSKETLDKLERLTQKSLAEMDFEEVQSTYRAIRMLTTHLDNLEKEVGAKRNREFAQLFSQFVKETKELKGQKDRGKLGSLAQHLRDEESLSPVNFLYRLGGYNKNSVMYRMAKQLEDGDRKRKGFVVGANNIFADFKKNNAKWIEEADGQGKKGVWYEASFNEFAGYDKYGEAIYGAPVTVEFTPLMKVALARGIRDNDILRHATGGITFPKKELYSKGQKAKAEDKGQTVAISPSMMKELFSYDSLTDVEKELFNLGDEFFDEFTKKAINETSQTLDGVDRAMNKHYTPIVIDKNYRNATIALLDDSLTGMGNLKNRTESEKQMMVVSFFDSVEHTTESISRYYGNAIPARNMEHLLNWSSINGKATTQKELANTWGGDANQYIIDLLANLQKRQFGKVDDIEKITSKTLSNSISSIFGFNPEIIMKQLSGLPAAAGTLGWNTLPSIPHMLDVETDLVNKYTPELAYRSLGYSSPELAQITRTPSKLSKAPVIGKFASGDGIQWMDMQVTKWIWAWAENKTKKAFPDLKSGSDEFYQKTAEFYNETLYDTQPVYDDMHRPNLLKSTNIATRAFTMFKTDSFLKQNLVRKTYGEWSVANERYKNSKTPENKKALNEAIWHLTDATTSVLASSLVFQTISFAGKAFRQSAKYYEDDDGEYSAESVMEKIMADVAVDMLGSTFVGAEEVGKIVQAAFANTAYYGIDAPGISELNEFVTDAQTAFAHYAEMLSTFDGDFDAFTDRYGRDMLKDAKGIATTIGKYGGGLPIENVEKFLMAPIRWIKPEWEEAFDAYWEKTDRRHLSGLTGEALQVRVDRLTDQQVEGVTDDSKKELARLYESEGVDVTPTETPSGVTVDGEKITFENSQWYEYKKAYSDAVGSNLNDLIESAKYGKLTDKRKAEAVTLVYNYGTAKAKEATVGVELTGAAAEFENFVEDGGYVPDYFHFVATKNGDSASAGLAKLKTTNYTQKSKAALYVDVVAKDSSLKQYDALQKSIGMSQEEFYKYAVLLDGETSKSATVGAISNMPVSDIRKADMFLTLYPDEKENFELAPLDAGQYFEYVVATDGMNKDPKMGVIDSMDLMPYQKDALYLLNWAESGLKNAPWK